MTIVNGWIEGLTRRLGPPNKVNPGKNDSLGIVCHSMEGGLEGSLNEMFKPERQASWMFSNPKFGGLIQHYPVTSRTWTSGNSKANNTLWAVESEGKAGEPLNANQVANMLLLAREFEAYTGKRIDRADNLWEHNEVWDWATPNAGPTACPSDRYEPFYNALLAIEEEQGMTEEQIRAIVRDELALSDAAATTRLNAAIQLRMAIQRIALDPDLAIVEQAAEALRGAGFKL